MSEKIAVGPLQVILLLLLCGVGNALIASGGDWLESSSSSLARKEDRVPLVVTEDGEVSAVNIFSGKRGPYHLQFFTLEPNSLLLPVLLHADMVLYVHTGSGTLSWTDDGKDMKRVSLGRGDLYRLEPGSVFFLHSNLDTESEREKLRIHAIFTSTREDVYEPAIGAYSSISDLVLGFDTKVLQSAFKASEDVIDEITSAARPPAIVHGAPTKKKEKKKPKFWRLLDTHILNSLVDARSGADEPFDANGHKKTKVFNVFEANPDFQNPNGWSLTVNKGDMKSLKGSQVSAFFVNLTRGSMMGPHWNPVATEIGIVLHGEGMVRVVCPGTANETECKNTRFRVREGDVFAVSRFHPMAQMAFNNDSFVFMGFSTTTKKNHPQFLVGKRSVFQALNREVLAMSFNVTNSTVIDELFNAQADEVIVRCTSCAEEEESAMEEELEREREKEEAREREEERAREEEEEREREQEEEAKRREEEEARKREEEKEREEEAAERAEAERRRREEEAMRKQEEARRHEEERARRRREREEEARRKEEEEEREREPEEEEEEAGGGEEERDWREQEEARRREERRRQQEEEEQMQREEEERQMREEMSRRREERQRHEEARRQEEVRRRHEEAQREEEEARRQAEERQRRRQPDPWEQEGDEGEEEPQEQEPEYGGGGWQRTLRKALRKTAA